MLRHKRNRVEEIDKGFQLKAVVTILFVFILVKTGLAQSCTGSVGDPIVNITFGAGTNAIAPSLPTGTTSLIYYSDDCPNDGEYTVTNRTTSCFANSWHSFRDHTGDANGYFMLVNASINKSDFYLQTIDGLCTGTTFQFAVWIMNVCNFTSAIPPEVILSIEKTDGTVLGKVSTGKIPVNTSVAEWKQYVLNFTVPAGVSSVVLRMHNDAPGGIGNDIALDDITFRPIGSKVTATTTNFPGDSLLLCAKDNQQITFHSSVEKCYITTGYQWQVSSDGGVLWTDIAGADKSDYTRMPTVAGTYFYRLSVAQAENIGSVICRVASNPFKIIVYDQNVRTISISKPDGAVCEDALVTFTASTSFAGSNPSFQWMLNNQPVVNAVDSVYTTSYLSNGDKVDCYFKSSLTCNDPLLSNAIPVAVLTKARSTIDTAICEGESYGGYTLSGSYTNVFSGSNGCDSLRMINLVVYPKQYSSFDTTICYGTSYLGLNRSGTYNSTYPSIHGCDSVHTIHLTVLPDINANSRMDTLLCTGDVITVSPGLFDTYEWSDGSTAETYNIYKGGLYNVSVANKCGSTTKTFIIQEQLCTVNFPTAFSPNNDGRNDLFRIVNGYDIGEFHLVLFNRWGQKIFESANPQQGWDGIVGGKQADNGVYLWFCNYANRSKPSDKISLKGTVTLIR